MPTSKRWLLRNIARRPVELHRASGVLIIPAFGSIEVDELDAHCLALVQSGSVAHEPAPPRKRQKKGKAEAVAKKKAATSAAAPAKAPGRSAVAKRAAKPRVTKKPAAEAAPKARLKRPAKPK